MRFHFVALGCKLNQAEAEDMQRELQSLGQEITLSPQQAHWAIVNTCTVTHVAARKSRRMIRHLHRQNPALRIAVTGCYAQMSPHEIGALEGVDLVISNQNKDTLVQRLLAAIDAQTLEQQSSSELVPAAPLTGGHTRAFVKIQDGCDNRCTYCIVTVARGPSRSRPADAILDEINQRIHEGYHEVVLTGVNIGAYGRDRGLPPSTGALPTLVELVQEILADTPVQRLRLSSLEPWDVDTELLSLWRDPRLCRHLHLPLQSGSDETLRRMNRIGDSGSFAQTVRAIRQTIPGVSLTTDIIVGFPGETADAFEQTLDFVERIAFSRLHVFKYSRRPGTVADTYTDQIDPRIAQQRSQQLIALGERLKLCFHQQCVGRHMQVLFESRRVMDGRQIWSGLTDTYVRVSVPCEECLANQVRTVACSSADQYGVWGEIVGATRDSSEEFCPGIGCGA